ncbi:MAG: diaminopimelate decarboxylase [Candidatus Altiarchaeota archaeon]
MDDRLLKRLAEEHGTPLYVYDERRIRSNLRRYVRAFRSRYPKVRIFYAYKANTSLAVCRIMKSEGAGADVVSAGELRTALKVGLRPEQILYTSNSKTPADLEEAVRAGVMINVDSVDEIEILGRIARRLRKDTRISFRINPSVNPRTHPKIATGLRNSKFGLHVEKNIAYDAYIKASRMENILVAGLQTHIGSQILETRGFEDATRKVMEFAGKLAEAGISLEFIDLGGGLGIPYQGKAALTPEKLASRIVPIFREGVRALGYTPELWLEPGRYIVGDAGILLTRVNSVKRTPYKNFVNVDCGFNTLMRPAMYGSYHRVSVLGRSGSRSKYDVAGNVCESGDILARDRSLPRVRAGDLIAVYDAGAYGFSMASEYNSQPLTAEVLVSGGRSHLIRERGRQDDLYRRQKIPAHLR